MQWAVIAPLVPSIEGGVVIHRFLADARLVAVVARPHPGLGESLHAAGVNGFPVCNLRRDQG